MASALNIFSEIGPLRTVLLHRPGEELLSLSPQNLGRLLFDDIPFLDVAREEHDAFASMLRQEGAEVLYLVDLVTEALEAAPQAKRALIDRYLLESGEQGDGIVDLVREYLFSRPDMRSLVKTCISGVRLNDLDISKATFSTLADSVSRDRCLRTGIVIDPIPNLYFTRDTFSVIGHSVSINSMRTATRRRETLFADILFGYHPRVKGTNLLFDGSASSALEGGDILVLSDDTLAIGISERTDAASIDALARNLFGEDSSFTRVLAFMLPHKRAFMHLDTVFTQADVDTFTVHPGILGTLEVYEIARGTGNDLRISCLEDSLDKILARGLSLDGVHLIKCGGDDPISADREQWNDGANTLAVRPGTVFVYQRNRVTNEILYKAGLNLLEVPSSELSRGRGGPHCMSMALWRERV